MSRFLLQTKNGQKPPKYEHTTIESAITEAKRLHEIHKIEVMILEIVGEIKSVEVPVTRTETKIDLIERYQSDDLPF